MNDHYTITFTLDELDIILMAFAYYCCFNTRIAKRLLELAIHGCKQPFSLENAINYELITDDGCAGCLHEAADRDMDCCWDCPRNPRRKRQDLYRHRPVGGGGHD